MGFWWSTPEMNFVSLQGVGAAPAPTASGAPTRATENRCFRMLRLTRRNQNLGPPRRMPQTIAGEEGPGGESMDSKGKLIKTVRQHVGDGYPWHILFTWYDIPRLLASPSIRSAVGTESGG